MLYLLRGYMAVLAAVPVWLAVSGEIGAADGAVVSLAVVALWRCVDPRRSEKRQLSHELRSVAHREHEDNP